jgi:hypothetical protein
MIHPLYRAHDGLIGMTPEERIQLIDALFAPEVSTAQERRELRLHPELLASQAEFFAKCLNLVKDCNEDSYVHLKRGKRAYSPEEFLEFLRGEPGHLKVLISLTREALRSRPEADDDDWPLSLQMCAPGEVPDITAEALLGLTLYERLQLGSNLPYAVGLRAEAVAAQRLSGDTDVSLHDLDTLLCEDDVEALAEIVSPYLSRASAA